MCISVCIMNQRCETTDELFCYISMFDGQLLSKVEIIIIIKTPTCWYGMYVVQRKEEMWTIRQTFHTIRAKSIYINTK